MRLVLDTNVLNSAFIAKGVCAELLEHCIRRHTVVTSNFILNEFRETMAGKFKFTREETEAALKAAGASCGRGRTGRTRFASLQGCR